MKVVVIGGTGLIGVANSCAYDLDHCAARGPERIAWDPLFRRVVRWPTFSSS